MAAPAAAVATSSRARSSFGGVTEMRVGPTLHTAASSTAATTTTAATAAPASSSSSSSLRTLENLPFDNIVLRSLPIDRERRNYTREVSGACFSLVEPSPIDNPKLVAYAEEVLRWIDLDPKEVNREEFVEYFSGNKILPGSRPAAHCYCGHQFGHFSGQLGDGATMYIGDLVNSAGERVEIQFKGAGPTPYSRRGDGRKVLRSSIREFLCSEANHYLGTIITSDTRVVRDIFYSGDAIRERATVITRLAPSFLRFGSFEIAKGTDATTGRAGPSEGRKDIIKQLLDFVVDNYYSDVCASAEKREEKYSLFFAELARRTAHTVARWQCVGWCHGVLNTDNMSILGITIDYGPFGYMESYDSNYICNASDDSGRYRYSAQPEICGWNMWKLSQQLEGLIPKEEMKRTVDGFESVYRQEYERIMRLKLGLGLWKSNDDAATTAAAAAKTTSGSTSASTAATESTSSAAAAEGTTPADRDMHLLSTFLQTMEETGGDFTNSFRILSSLKCDDSESMSRVLSYLVSQSASLHTKLAALAPKVPPQQLSMLMNLMRSHPQLFAGGAMEEQMSVINAEIERKKQREELSKMSQQQKEEQDRQKWQAWLVRYHSALKTDSEAAAAATGRSPQQLYEERRRVQNSVNPKYILRNWIAQTVIDAAEKGDYSLVRECLQRLRDPYDVDDIGEASESAAEKEGKAGMNSAAEMEEQATHSKPHESERTFDDDGARKSKPPQGTQCAIHWNKRKPDWALGLKVT